MGYTFAAALVKKTGTAPATRKAIREGLENLGCRKASNAEDASLVLPLHHDKKSAWMTIALEMPESIGRQMELLRQLAAEMHTAILYFMNFDSDYLYVGATDGKAVQHVHVGFIDEEDEAMTDSDDLSVFDALLPDEAARAEFRRILAVDDEERVFSEEAAEEMAALFGYTPEALFIDEDAEPFAVLAFDLPGQEVVPFLMPEDAPPAFKLRNEMVAENPMCLTVHYTGGTGRGIIVGMEPEGYDADDWDVIHVTVETGDYMTYGTWEKTGVPSYRKRVIPRKVTFDDGSKGWIAEFPDAPIIRGINPDFKGQHNQRMRDYYLLSRCHVRVAFSGGHFRHEQRPVPLLENESYPEHFRRVWAEMERFRKENDEYTRIWVMPMENMEGGTVFRATRVPLETEKQHRLDEKRWPGRNP